MRMERLKPDPAPSLLELIFITAYALTLPENIRPRFRSDLGSCLTLRHRLSNLFPSHGAMLADVERTPHVELKHVTYHAEVQPW